MSAIHVANHRLVIEAVIHGDPQGKGRPRTTKTGHVYTPARTRKAQDELAGRLLAMRARPAPPGVEVAMHMHFHLRTERRVDIDNLVKLVLDAANHVLFDDDSQIAALAATRVRASGRPRTEVRAWML